jgi:hypothetical protein
LFIFQVIWTDKNGESAEHCWEYNHIDKGKDVNEYKVYGSKGLRVGEYGSLGETYRNLKGSHGSVLSVHESGGDGHITLGNYLPNLEGGHLNLGDSHVNLEGDHVTLGDIYANLGDSHVNLEGDHVTLRDIYANLGDSYVNIEDSHGTLGGVHVRLGELSDSYANPGDIPRILSNNYGGFSGSNSILGSLGSIYANIAEHYKSLENNFIHNAATHERQGGKLKGETEVGLPTYETSGETTSENDFNKRSLSSNGDHGHFGNGSSNGARVTNSAYNVSASASTEVRDHDRSPTG